MMCGFLQHETAVFNPLFGSLPRVVAVNGRSGDKKQHLFDILQIIEEESRAARPGGSCLLARLTELMFIEVLRAYLLEAPSNGGGWLRGTQDPFVSRSLQLLHSAPDRDWTLETLCREVGRSRSALAEGFSQLVGLPPMQYLARWRMELAAQQGEQRRLAAAVRSDDADLVPDVDGERRVLEQSVRATGQRDVVEAEHRLNPRCRSRSR